MNLIIDAHEDIAWNIATFNRNYCQSARDTRSKEAGSLAPTVVGDTLLGYPDYLDGHIAVVFGTLFASPQRLEKQPWATQCYRSSIEAQHLYQGQVDLYRRLADDHPNQFKLIGKKSDLCEILASWQHFENSQAGESAPAVGIVISMEGAEGVMEPGELYSWWERGVRIIGPAWKGNQYCGGTGEPGPLTKEGKRLLTVMSDIGFVLDISHMDEQAARQALDMYPLQVIASHSNVSKLIRGYEGNRHLSDALVEHIIERNGIIGIVCLNQFLNREWKTQGGRSAISLNLVADQVDYICQIAGSSTNVGIGSDFDGSYGWQNTPIEIDSIADLQKLTPILEAMQYKPENIQNILGLNWQRMLSKNLP